MNAITLNMTATAGANSPWSEADFDKELAKLGAESINTARPKLAITICRAAYLGGLGEDGVAAKYDLYLAGREKAQSKSLLAAGVEDGNGRRANVSKLVQVCKLGALPAVDGPAIIDRTVTLRGSMIGGDAKIEAPFDAMVKVARAQLLQPGTELTDDQIMACIRKAEPKDKDLLAKLVATYKAAWKINAEAAMQETQDIVDSIATAIRAIDEDAVPAMTKEEKAEMAFMAEARKRGMA